MLDTKKNHKYLAKLSISEVSLHHSKIYYNQKFNYISSQL